MEYGLIGEKLGHSYSREIHARIGDYRYELKELPPDRLSDFFRERDFRGINVTIPYKAAVIPYLDEISEAAARIGAVNTVVNRGGKLYGHNTDYEGLKRLILRITGGEPLSGETLILGSGGTARTAAAVARDLGAGAVRLVSRTPGEGELSYPEAAQRAGASFLINTTPVGMFPADDGIPIDPNVFPALTGLADAIYHPLRTRLVCRTSARGIPAEGGLYMLVAQAVAASAFFFGTAPDEALTDRIFRSLRQEKENIVLTGMPASGKTTVGRILADALGRSLIDTDREIEKDAGRSIPAIFAEEGEASFRERESRVIAALSSGVTGSVIATGGGAILRRDNVERLQANGRLYWLDRPPELLAPTEDRPLAATREAIQARYRERLPRYRSTCDKRIDSAGSPADAAALILADRRI